MGFIALVYICILAWVRSAILRQTSFSPLFPGLRLYNRAVLDQTNKIIFLDEAKMQTALQLCQTPIAQNQTSSGSRWYPWTRDNVDTGSLVPSQGSVPTVLSDLFYMSFLPLSGAVFLLQIKKHSLSQRACSRMSPDRHSWEGYSAFCLSSSRGCSKISQTPCCLWYYPFSSLVAEMFYKHWENNEDFYQFQARRCILLEMTMYWGIPNISFHYFCFTGKFKSL